MHVNLKIYPFIRKLLHFKTLVRTVTPSDLFIYSFFIIFFLLKWQIYQPYKLVFLRLNRPTHRNTCTCSSKASVHGARALYIEPIFYIDFQSHGVDDMLINIAYLIDNLFVVLGKFSNISLIFFFNFQKRIRYFDTSKQCLRSETSLL